MVSVSNLAVWEAAGPYLRARKNDVHVPLSYAMAEDLLDLHPAADAQVVQLGILLHDIGWALVDPVAVASERVGPDMLRSQLRIEHEQRGAALARELLAGTGHEPGLIDEIAEIIDGHDTRLHALSLNDSLVKDADKLWRYTTAGIAVGCDLFALTPGEYAANVTRELDRVMFTDQARTRARHELAIAHRELRLDVLATPEPLTPGGRVA